MFLKFEIFLGKFKIKRNEKKAAKSKIPTILNKNATPSRKPESIKIFFAIFSFAVKIRKPDKIIGRSIKFSEFAIFPSTIGKAKRSPKITVEKIAIFSTVIFGLLFALPIVEGNIANSENFMLLPIILSGFLIFTAKEKMAKNILILSGFLLGVAFLFKIVGIFDFAAFFSFLFILNLPKKISNFKNIVYAQIYFLLQFVLGFLLPIAASSLFFLFHGFSVFKYFLQATFVQNVGYVGYGNKFIIP